VGKIKTIAHSILKLFLPPCSAIKALPSVSIHSPERGLKKLALQLATMDSTYWRLNDVR
jgi:hypothetical protein